MEVGQPPRLDWRGGVPVARGFDDPYYSLGDGYHETVHVFLGGNDLPARFRAGFHIAELGFGTGLNCLTALTAWRASKEEGALRFTSFEAFPMPPRDILRALQPFDAVAGLAEPLAAVLDGDASALPDLDLTVVAGDARQTLPAWGGMADAWFLDGFAPAKNPELWEPTLMHQVARHTAAGGTFATYTAAGFVRRSLAEAGFDVQRSPGYGRKRHMARGVFR